MFLQYAKVAYDARNPCNEGVNRRENMKKSKIILALTLAVVILISQIGVVFAAPANKAAPLTGTVQSITLETDVNTAAITVIVTILDKNNVSQTLRLSVDTAKILGLITTDANGTPVINMDALGTTIQIDPKTVIADDGANRHPVGDALATFFSDIIDYDTIMAAHQEGSGFGVIAQALWLTKKLEGNAETFSAILSAKETGDFSAFVLADGTTLTNWGQFKKAVLDGDKKGNLGVVMSTKNKDDGNNGNGNGNANNNGNSHGNSNNGNGSNNNNGNKDKDKDKGKDN